MAPGNKHKNQQQTRAEPRAIEASLTAYEKERMQNILEQNRMYQRLGIGQLRAILNAKPVQSTKPAHASKPMDAAREDSGSLYQPGDEDSEQEAVDKEAMLDLELELSNNLQNNVTSNIGGSRTSKRVMAISKEQSQPARITRKRARESSEPAEVCHVPATAPQDGATDQELIVANAHAQSDNRSMTHEGPCINKKRMGRGLDRITRGLNSKILVHVAQGNRRPEAPMQAAKLASEAGIIIRDSIPIFPHWKDYKKDGSKDLLDDYMGKIGIQFDIDINNQPVKDACSDILKKRQRNNRYLLKKQYFNDVPANQVRTTSPLASMNDEQWKKLVEMWSNPKHKEKCLKAKNSREQVKLQQKTGSRSYVAHCYVAKQTKYKDVPPNAIDLFKETHCSSKTGFSENARFAIAQMEEKAAAPPQEGQDAVTPTQAVHEVIPKSSFLANIGMQPAAAKRGTKASEVDARVHELESELVAEKEGSAVVRAQVDDVVNKLEVERAARKVVEEEHEMLKKQIAEMHGFFRSFVGGNSAQE